MWVPILAAALASYVLKVAGHLVPSRWLDGELARSILALLPVCLLAALVVVEVAGDGRHLVLDARAAGLAVAAIALWRRAPFLLVVISAIVTTAAVRALT